jgi:opacity protein-like surface antigen
LAYLPLGCSKDFSLLATAGIGEYVYKQKFLGQKHNSEHGYGYRFGGGFKYAITPAWQTRLITRYVNFDGLHGYDHAVEYTLSLQYHF